MWRNGTSANPARLISFGMKLSLGRKDVSNVLQAIFPGKPAPHLDPMRHAPVKAMAVASGRPPHGIADKWGAAVLSSRRHMPAFAATTGLRDAMEGFKFQSGSISCRIL
ncbi:hypothetical protein [uncultured Paracoccus sp.]|nr:hypothetical protein [uncultured Paracoccus sp.]